jgi:hypothetical protein
MYWADWENDPALAMCSMAAQGYWMRLLCLAHKAMPVGYVIQNGDPMPVETIAFLTRTTVGDATAWISELRENGVLSVDRKGRIYSRRMVRDEAQSQKNQENGKKGGNPNLRKDRGKSAPVNPGVKAYAEAEAEHKQKEKVIPQRVIDLSQSIWDAASDLMRSRSSRKLVQEQVMALGQKATPAIVDALKAYLNTKDVREGFGHPALHRWLADEKFDPFLKRPSEAASAAPEVTPAQWMGFVMRFKEVGRWHSDLGPRPDQHGCRAPAKTLAEMGYA